MTFDMSTRPSGATENGNEKPLVKVSKVYVMYTQYQPDFKALK